LTIQEGREINLFWLPSHKGILDNEMTDLLAKKATSLGHKSYFKISHIDLSVEIKESLNKHFKAYLEEQLDHYMLHFIRACILLALGSLKNRLIEGKLCPG